MNEQEAIKKKRRLHDFLRGLDSLLIAFSGGVDSAYLLSEAHRVLGKKVAAATADSPIHPARELKEAIQFTQQLGVEHIIFPSEEMDLEAFLLNSSDRCYHCKKALSQKLLAIAEEMGISHVAHGANMDDLGDFRPGFKAAVQAGLLAPLMEAGLQKTEIRFLAKERGLPQWDKPAMACLASRIPYGDAITERTLHMVDRAEEFLRNAAFAEVRVRCHGSTARIEAAPGRIQEIVEDPFRNDLVHTFRKIGFEHIALDLEGYVQGKMNRDLRKNRLESGSD